MKKLIIILTIQALFVGPFASAEDSMAAIDLERLKSKIALIESHFASQMASAGICGEYLKSRRIDATGVSSSLNDLISSKKNSSNEELFKTIVQVSTKVELLMKDIANPGAVLTQRCGNNKIDFTSVNEQLDSALQDLNKYKKDILKKTFENKISQEIDLERFGGDN